VQEMVAASGRSAADVVAVVPPRWAEASVEHVAINAVMAGCRPEVMPLLMTGLEAACDPAFGLFSLQATTHPCAVLMVVSGPIIEQLKLNYQHGALAPGHRVNATLGRAMRLILMNVGGGLPGKGDQATHGSPAKFSYVLAENEAANPWEPFRVQRGFAREDSTVTVVSGEGPHNINDHICTTPHSILRVVASTMATLAHNNVTGVSEGDVLVVLGPEHAHSIAAGGLSRTDVQQFLWEAARNPLYRLNDQTPTRRGNWPKWVCQDDPDALVPIVGKPEDIMVIVSGGPGKHSAFIPTFGLQKSVTRRVPPTDY